MDYHILLCLGLIQQMNLCRGMIDETKADVCMGHLEINGFQMNKMVMYHKVVEKNSLESLILL